MGLHRHDTVLSSLVCLFCFFHPRRDNDCILDSAAHRSRRRRGRKGEEGEEGRGGRGRGGEGEVPLTPTSLLPTSTSPQPASTHTSPTPPTPSHPHSHLPGSPSSDNIVRLRPSLPCSHCRRQFPECCMGGEKPTPASWRLSVNLFSEAP